MIRPPAVTLAATRRPGLRAARALTLPAALPAPRFFDLYRGAVFNTGRRDDNAPYLLYLVGDSGVLPGAPLVYRFLPLAVAMRAYPFCQPAVFFGRCLVEGRR